MSQSKVKQCMQIVHANFVYHFHFPRSRYVLTFHQSMCKEIIYNQPNNRSIQTSNRVMDWHHWPLTSINKFVVEYFFFSVCCVCKQLMDLASNHLPLNRLWNLGLRSHRAVVFVWILECFGFFLLWILFCCCYFAFFRINSIIQRREPARIIFTYIFVCEFNFETQQ